MKFLIEFTIPKNGSSLLNKETKNIKDSLHEALCLAIYENDEDAIDWLQNHISNISDDIGNHVRQPGEI